MFFHFSDRKFLPGTCLVWSGPTVLSLLTQNVSFFKKCRKLAEASAFFLIVNSIPFQPRLLLPPSAALKSRREIKRESLILPSNTRTLKLPLPWTHKYASDQLSERWLQYQVKKLHLELFHRIPLFTRCQSLWQPEMGKLVLATWTFRTLFPTGNIDII